MTARRFLVTAGSTREMIDRVRAWGNIFTGKTGYDIARALMRLGTVDLLTSNAQHAGQAPADGIVVSTFSSHADLKELLAARLARQRYDAVFMTAAVADYRPAGVYQVVARITRAGGVETWEVRNVRARKVKSNHGRIAVMGEQTEKLIDLFRTQWGHTGLLFKFKLEVGIGKEALLKIGEASRKASGADYLVANTLDMVQGENAGAYLLSDQGSEFIGRGELADKLAEATGRHFV